MKLFRNLSKGLGLCVFLFASFTSCVNHITEENEMNNGNIPLRFVANIQEATNTRVVGNEFEEGDELGLFALAGNTTMKEERYADNLHFVRSSEGELVSDESVYYPDDGVTLNLISYYPYQKEGVAMGESAMQVSVASEQDIPVNRSHSDFLIASKDNVLASKEAVPLTYKHKFFKLKIVLALDKEEDITTLLNANPELSIDGFYTKAFYDYQENTFLKFSDEKSIIPAGEWQQEDGKLVGKELILIPQETTAGYQYVTIEVGGKTYSSMLPSSLKMQSGKQRELEIAFKSDEDILMSKVNGDIEDWEGTIEIDQTESETIHKYVEVSKLTFEPSNVYRVLHAGHQVAEICKEYLVTPEFSSQAIVAYPMKTDSHQADLSKGIVVQLLEQSGKVHGGSVSWNMEEHSLKYTPGTMAAKNYVYILADGQVTLSITMSDEVQSVLALGDVARDVRGGMIHDYPMVKIGTQYWMREDLKASLYIDGEKIPKLTAMAEDATGYLLSDAGNYLYSTNSVVTHKLQFGEWNIPEWSDWDILKDYLKEDASLLKAGTWKPMKSETTITDVNNKSGFSAIPVGMGISTFIADYEGRYVGYWTLDKEGDKVDQYFLLKSNSNEMAKGTLSTDKAFSIRCIRK